MIQKKLFKLHDARLQLQRFIAFLSIFKLHDARLQLTQLIESKEIEAPFKLHNARLQFQKKGVTLSQQELDKI